MRLQDQLTEAISEQVETVVEPAPDLHDAVRRGRGIRRRRNLFTYALPVVAAAVVGALVIGSTKVGTQAPAPDVAGPETFAPVGMLDYSQGLRAFASPDEDGELWIGGRSFRTEDKGYLDTDATATPYGLVFFDRADQAHLLAQDGTDQTLAAAPAEKNSDLNLSAKADARLPLVAFTQPTAGGVAVLLDDLETGRTIDTVDVPCDGSQCKDVRVDGLDRGLVFVRTEAGTFVWDRKARGDARWTLLGTGEFRVADARNGRVLWSGAAPAPAPRSPVADWQFTQGQIDAELSYDGRHVLYWSPILKPTEPSGRAIRLKLKGAGWFTFDTDGSVLAAVSGSDQHSTFYDCAIPSGTCQRIGSVSTTSGDPMFIGNDM